MLTKERILALFAELNDELCRSGVRGDVFIVGGAAMTLAYDVRPATRARRARAVLRRPTHRGQGSVLPRRAVGWRLTAGAVPGEYGGRAADGGGIVGRGVQQGQRLV